MFEFVFTAVFVLNAAVAVYDWRYLFQMEATMPRLTMICLCAIFAMHFPLAICIWREVRSHQSKAASFARGEWPDA